MTATRTAIVVGGARGIGAATARRLAARGDAVVIVDRGADDARVPYALAGRDDLERSVADAREAAVDPGLVSGVVADVTDEDELRAVVEAAEDRHAGIDAVIVTAAVIAGGMPLWEMPRDQVRAVVHVDLEGTISAARVAVPALLRRPVPRAGRFVALASAAATRGLPMLAVYGAAKAGVVGLVRTLAVELRGTGVTANAVSPGSTDTAMLAETARLYGLADASAFAGQQPIERLIAPEEVAAAIAWLAGPEAGAVTGVDYAVDGGLSV